MKNKELKKEDLKKIEFKRKGFLSKKALFKILNGDYNGRIVKFPLNFFIAILKNSRIELSRRTLHPLNINENIKEFFIHTISLKEVELSINNKNDKIIMNTDDFLEDIRLSKIEFDTRMIESKQFYIILEDIKKQL